MLVGDAAGLLGSHEIQGKTAQISRFIVCIGGVGCLFTIEPMPNALTIFVIERSIPLMLELMMFGS